MDYLARAVPSFPDLVAINLQGLEHVHVLRLDVRTLPSSAISDILADPGNTLQGIHDLEVGGCIWPGPTCIRSITDAFPELRVLRMSQNTTWCNLCNTCGVSAFADDPPPLFYKGGYGLPVRTLFIYLSRLQMNARGF